MKKKISVSMMCADFLRLEDQIREFERSGIELLHIDVMDGEFVRNFTLGTDFCRRLREVTDIPLDIHLMINRPEDKLGWFEIRAGEYVSVHYESTPHIHRALGYIKDLGGRALVALNPGTPICMVENLFPIIDGVLLMTVNPGFAGQSMVSGAIEKIAATREYLDIRGYNGLEIEVDGNVSFENAEKMSRAGADIFVAGSSSVFMKGNGIGENVVKMREALNQEF